MKKILASCILLLCAALIITGCTEQQATTDELKIGVVASMTGPASTTGKDIWQSAVLAAEEINADGGVFVKEFGANIPLKVILGDDESTREGGQKAVTRLITEDNVDILVGGFSSAVVSAHQSIASDHGVPYIVTGASSPIITHRTDVNTSYIFHHCPTTDDYGRQTILFANEVIRPAINQKFGFSADRPLRLAIVYQDSPYGKGVQNAVISTIQSENLPVVVVANETFKMGETDFRTVLTSVKSAEPDVIYPAAFLNEQIPMVTQARRDVGLNAIFLAVECNDDPDYYSGVGQFGEYSIIETRFSPYTVPQGPIQVPVEKFLLDFDEMWDGFPGMMGASTYEGVYIAVQAVEDAGTLDKANVRDALVSLKMPEIIEVMKDGTIAFTPEYREGQFKLYMEQLRWNEAENELRPVIIWPDDLKEDDFMLPDWFTPGRSE
ncbi:MAG TPA: ABC transporter substrate-binding protein [Methanoregulaceae archaeon]|nr:ABC transporter substrate-binding protein [Methanoregulaceae archaeon]